MTVSYRYFANRTLIRGPHPETGEPLYFHRGDEIPAEQFGSGNALRSALNTGQVAAVPIADGDSEELIAARAASPAVERARTRR